MTVSNITVCGTFYSAFGLSTEIKRLFELLQRFVVGGFSDSDADSVDLFRTAKKLVNETRDEKVDLNLFSWLLNFYGSSLVLLFWGFKFNIQNIYSFVSCNLGLYFQTTLLIIVMLILQRFFFLLRICHCS